MGIIEVLSINLKNFMKFIEKLKGQNNRSDEKEKIETNFKEQKSFEDKNKEKNLEDLKNKFNEILKENPIVFYSKKFKNEKPMKTGTSFNLIKDVRTDESGTGGNIGFTASYADKERKEGYYDSYFFVDKNKANGHYEFNSKDESRITKESFQNIVTIMNDLIKISGYSEKDKNQMFLYVIDNFKDKILKDEDLK